jgi:anti-anti-sigma factor
MTDYSSYKSGDAGEVLVVEVKGKLDSSNSKTLTACLQGHIDDGEHKIVLDCSGLNAISSEGLAVLVQINKRLKTVGGKFSLAGVKGTVADVLKIVHFDRLFKLFGSVDEAAKAF